MVVVKMILSFLQLEKISWHTKLQVSIFVERNETNKCNEGHQHWLGKHSTLFEHMKILDTCSLPIVGISRDT